jgi:hypothetical protein
MLARIKNWLVRRRLADAPFYVRTHYSFEGGTLRAFDPIGFDQRLTTSQFVEVGIETTSLCPFAEDVFWLINRHGESVRVPQCSPVFGELLKHFEVFTDFDWEACTRAMACTDDAYFSCWSRKLKTKHA